MKKITGFFESKTKKGDTYLSGKIDGKRVALFRNNFRKEGTRQPEWYLYELEERAIQHQTAIKIEQPAIQDEDIPF